MRTGPKPRPMEDRFFEKVEGGDHTTCWLWTGSQYSTTGRPYISVGHAGRVLAYRWSWEFFNGPIPEGLTIDHLCRVPLCVNPWHLEPVTQSENSHREAGRPRPRDHRTHCRNGHELTPENTRVYGEHMSRRECRTCVRTKALRYYHKKSLERSGAA